MGELLMAVPRVLSRTRRSSRASSLRVEELLGQWVADVLCLPEWLARQPNLQPDRLALAGLGQAGLVALCAAGLQPVRVAAVAALDGPVTLVTEEAYASGTRMGLLAPGLLRAGDVPQLAALSAPRKLALWGGVSPQGKKLDARQLAEAYAFTRKVYGLEKAEDRLNVREAGGAAELVAWL